MGINISAFFRYVNVGIKMMLIRISLQGLPKESLFQLHTQWHKMEFAGIICLLVKDVFPKQRIILENNI